VWRILHQQLETMRGARIDVEALARKAGGSTKSCSGAPSRIVVTLESKDLARLEAIATKHSVPCFKLGTVEGDHLVVKNKGADAIDLASRL